MSAPPRKVTRRSSRVGLGTVRVHGEIEGERRGAFETVYALVRRIPRGRVMTYGQISTLLSGRLSPVAVGWALHGCPGNVPWQRVVNASGGLSTERLPDIPLGLQKAILEAERVPFRQDGTVDLERSRWTPPGTVAANAPGRSPSPRRSPARPSRDDRRAPRTRE